MEEPRRLLDGGGTELEQGLLRAALEEESGPSSHSMRRAALALGVATGASTFTKTLWAAREALQPLGAKVVAGSVLVGSAALVAVPFAISPGPSGAPSVEAPTAQDGAAQEMKEAVQLPVDELESDAIELDSLELEQAIEPEPPLDAAPAKSHRHRASSAKVAPVPPGEAASTIAAEVSALDAARRSLDGGNPAVALSKLDAYKRDFPKGSLGQEALVMRIRALVAAGKSSEAESLAARFRAQNPESPYNKRIESIVSRGNH